MSNQQITLDECRRWVAADMIIKEYGEFQNIEMQPNRIRVMMPDGRVFFVKLALVDAGHI